MEAQFDGLPGVQSTPFQDQRWSATAARTPHWSEGSSCSALPVACCSSSFNTSLAAIVANHLRENPASKGPLAVGPGTTGTPNTIMSRQSCLFGTASRVQLSWLALHQHVKGPPRNSRIVHACAVCGSPTCPCEFTRGTRSRGSGAMLEGFVDDFPQTRSVVDGSSQWRYDSWRIFPSSSSLTFLTCFSGLRGRLPPFDLQQLRASRKFCLLCPLGFVGQHFVLSIARGRRLSPAGTCDSSAVSKHSSPRKIGSTTPCDHRWRLLLPETPLSTLDWPCNRSSSAFETHLPLKGHSPSSNCVVRSRASLRRFSFSHVCIAAHVGILRHGGPCRIGSGCVVGIEFVFWWVFAHSTFTSGRKEWEVFYRDVVDGRAPYSCTQHVYVWKGRVGGCLTTQSSNISKTYEPPDGNIILPMECCTSQVSLVKKPEDPTTLTSTVFAVEVVLCCIVHAN